MEGGSAIFLVIDCCNNNTRVSGLGAGVWPLVQIWSPASASAAVTELLGLCGSRELERAKHNYSWQYIFLLYIHVKFVLSTSSCRVCKFQDVRRHHDKCRSHPCWRGAACPAPGKPQPRERQSEEAAKNLSKSPSSESEVLQVEPNLVAWPQVQFPDIIQFIARQWQYKKYFSCK